MKTASNCKIFRWLTQCLFSVKGDACSVFSSPLYGARLDQEEAKLAGSCCVNQGENVTNLDGRYQFLVKYKLPQEPENSDRQIRRNVALYITPSKLMDV
jgi:hypothetical protein